MKVYTGRLIFGFKYWKNFKGQNQPDFRNVNLRKDYYKILEIENDANTVKIRKSYLKLAKKLHPDVNPSGHTQFTQVQEAYNVLSDGERKKYYDNNNSFYSPPKGGKDTNKDSSHDFKQRDRQFYEYMKNKGFENFTQKDFERYQQQYREKRQKEKYTYNEEEYKEKSKIQDQINFARKILFTRNPLWQQANAYMNYESRYERQMEKEKEFQALFPKGTRLASKFKKWMSKY